MLRAGAFAALVVLACAASAQAAHPGRNGRIAYAESIDTRGSSFGPFIVTVRADGSGPRRLTGGFDVPYIDFDPAWSPDGKRIAFVRSTGNTIGPETIGTEIWVMNGDGKHERRLTHNRLFDGNPGWSPDGKRILFARGRVRFGDRRHRPFSDLWKRIALGTRRGVATVAPDGSDLRVVGPGAFPAWAPDGSVLVASAPYTDPFTGLGILTFVGTWTPITIDPAPGALQAVAQFGAEAAPLSYEGSRLDQKPFDPAGR